MDSPSFKQVPGYPNISISKCGMVLDTKENKFLPFRATDYYRVSINGVDALLHRLLALAYIERPNDLKHISYDDLDVNHKDGNKLNARLDNLEWCTRQFNCDHAYRTGLRKDNRAIEVMHILTKEIESFYSLQECARAFGVNGGFVHRWIKVARPFRTIKGYCLFKYKEDLWPEIDEDKMEEVKQGEPKPVIATNIETQQNIIFESVVAAAKQLNLTEMKVRRYLYGNNKPVNNWTFQYLNDLSKLPEELRLKQLEKMKSWKRTPRKPIPIIVINTETQNVSNWPSIEEFAKTINVSKNTLQKHIWRTNGLFKEWRIQYNTSPT